MSDIDGQPTEPDANIGAGSTFGAWTLDSYVAEGGFGVVWRAHDSDGTQAAIKFLLNHGGRSRFLQEHMLASLQDGHWTPRVFDADLTAATPWISFEYLEDRTVQDQSPLPDSDLRSFALNLWLAISSLHLAGISHRDITPRNVFMDAGEVKLIDFGLAKQVSDAGGLTELALGGTPGFAAPEQFDTEIPVGQAADIWAWGTVVYFAATGARVYSTRGANPQSLFQYVETLTRHDPSQLTDIPDWLQTALRSALELDPAERSRDAISAVLPASDKDQHFMKMALQLFEVQGAQVQNPSKGSEKGAPQTVIEDRSFEIAALRAQLYNLEQSQTNGPVEEPRKGRRVAAIIGAVCVAGIVAVGGMSLIGSDNVGDSRESAPAETTSSSSGSPAEEQQPNNVTSETPEPTGGPVTELASSETNAASVGTTLSALSGAPSTTDRGTALGRDRPGAMSIRLDQAGCADAAQEYSLELPEGSWNVVGNVALSDETPDDANIEVLIGDRSDILTADGRNASFDVPSASGSVTISAETLSAFGSTCGEMPIEVLIFDSFIR